MLELQQILVKDFGVPVGISALVWVDVCWVVVVDKKVETDLGGEVYDVIKIPNRNWFLEGMGVVLSNYECLFHLLLPDNSGIAHQ